MRQRACAWLSQKMSHLGSALLQSLVVLGYKREPGADKGQGGLASSGGVGHRPHARHDFAGERVKLAPCFAHGIIQRDDA